MNFFQRLFRKKPEGDPDNPTEARKLPAILPSDLKIEISRAGTFVMSSERILVKNNRLVYTKNNFENGTIFECEVNNNLTEQLFLILQKNTFDKIKIVEDLRMDYPSNHVSVYWGNYFISKGESQTEQFHKGWEDLYMRCKFELIDAISAKLKDQNKKIKVVIAEGMFTQDDWFHISCMDFLDHYYYSNNKIVFLEDYTTKTEVSGPPELISYLPDFSEFTVELQKKGKPALKGKLVFPKGTFDTITFYEENNELRWKLS